MPPTRGTTTTLVETLTHALLLTWLCWLPMPYGSITAFARPLLIVVPLVLCAVAAGLRLVQPPDDGRPMVAWRIWTVGGALFVAVVAMQLAPLPGALLASVSPESQAIWSSADEVAALLRDQRPVPAAHPISVDPGATAHELFRMLALFATFQAAAMLVRSHRRRVAFASVLCGAALFEMLYGVREAAMRRYSIWGWVNTKILDRVTGTFVNPNHFAHYLAIILPLALFLGAIAWHHATSRATTFRRRVLYLVERSFVMFGFALITAVGCVAAVLLAQSRGGLLAMAGGFAVMATLTLRRHPTKHLLALGAAGVFLVVALVVFLGRERTVERFKPHAGEELTLVGRRIGIEAALGVWRRFPILGSGAGTFEDVVSMTQKEDVARSYHHAHDDYAEIAATTGTVGFVVAMVALLAGAIALVRATFGRRAQELSWRRRAFQAAALTSLSIAMVHALFDFNFYIPANPATLAAILGAAVSFSRPARAAGSDSA